MTSGDSGGRATVVTTVSAKRIAHAVSLQLVFRVAGMVASVLTVSLTTRHLGADSYGHLTTAVVFIGLWTCLTELGVGAVIVRRVTSGAGDLERLVRVNSGLSLLYCLPLSVLAAVTGLVVYRNDAELQVMLLIVSGSLTLTALSSCFEPVFQATVRFTAVAVSDLVSRVLSLGATVLLITMHAHLYWFAAVQLVPPAVQLVIQGFAASRLISFHPVLALRESWSLLRESLPQTGVLVIAVLYWRVDGVILSLLSTSDQVGVYGLAYTVAFTMSVVSTFFLNSTLSTMTERYASDRNAFARFVIQSVEGMIFVGAPIAVFGVVMAGRVVSMMSSATFSGDGGRTLGALFVGVALTFLTGALSQALFAAHDQVFLLRLNVVNLVINIVLNIAFVRPLGAFGAGLALVVTELSGLIVVSWRLHARLPYRTPWPFLARLCVPVAGGLAVALLTLHWQVVISAALAGAAYLGLNLLVGPVNLSMLKALRGGEQTETEATETEQASIPQLPEPSRTVTGWVPIDTRYRSCPSEFGRPRRSDAGSRRRSMKGPQT